MNYKMYKIHHSRGKSDTNFFQEKTILNGAYASLKVLRVTIFNDMEKIKKKNSLSKNRKTKKINNLISNPHPITTKSNENVNFKKDSENKNPDSADVLLTLIIRVLLFKQELDFHFFDEKLNCLKTHLNIISLIIKKNIEDLINELITECPKVKNNLIIRSLSNLTEGIIIFNDTKAQDFYREIKDALLLQWQKNHNKIKQTFEYYEKLNSNNKKNFIFLDSNDIIKNEYYDPIMPSNYEGNVSKTSNSNNKSYEDEYSEDPIVVSFLLSKKKEVLTFMANITQGILFSISRLYYKMDYYSIIISSLIFKIFYGIMLFISSNKDRKDKISEHEKAKKGKLYHIIDHIICLAKNYSKNAQAKEINIEYCGLNSLSKFILNNFVQMIPKCMGIKDTINENKFNKETLYQYYSKKRCYKYYLESYKKFDDNQLLKIFRLYYNSKLTFWKSIISFKIEDIQSLVCRICLKKIPINELFLHVNYCIEQTIFYRKISEFNSNFEHFINKLDCYLAKLNQNLTPINKKLFGKGGYLFNIINRLPGCEHDEDGEIFIKSLIRLFKYEKSKPLDYYENKPEELSYVFELGYFIYVLYETNKSSHETDQELSEILGGSFISVLQKIMNIFIFLYTRKSKVKNTAMKDKTRFYRKRGSRSKSRNNPEYNNSHSKDNNLLINNHKKVGIYNNDDQTYLYDFRNAFEKYKSKLSVNNMMLVSNSIKKVKHKNNEKGFLYMENNKNNEKIRKNNPSISHDNKKIKKNNNFSPNKNKSPTKPRKKITSSHLHYGNNYDDIKNNDNENQHNNEKNSDFYSKDIINNDNSKDNNNSLIKNIFHYRSVSQKNVHYLIKKQKNHHTSLKFLKIKELFFKKIKIKHCISSGNIYLNKDLNSTKKSKSSEIEKSFDSIINNTNNTNNIHVLNYSESESISEYDSLHKLNETNNTHKDIDNYMSNVVNNNLSPIPILRSSNKESDSSMFSKSSFFKNNNFNDKKKETLKSKFNNTKDDIKNSNEEENLSYNNILVEEEDEDVEKRNELKDKNFSNSLSISDFLVENKKKRKKDGYSENIIFNSESSSDNEIEKNLSNMILHNSLFIDPESEKMIKENQITIIYDELIKGIDDKIINNSNNKHNSHHKNKNYHKKTSLNNELRNYTAESYIENAINKPIYDDIRNMKNSTDKYSLHNNIINNDHKNNVTQQKLKHIETPNKEEILKNENYLPSDKKSKISSFKLLFPIAKGGYGSVALYKNITTGDFFAIKTVNIDRMKDKNLSNTLQNEQTILKEVNNDYVVSSYFIFRDEKNYYFVMEYLPGGDVYTLLSKLFLPEKAIQLIVAETILAVNYLHQICIIHHDIKPENILITKEGHFKLSDFGLSKSLTNKKGVETLHVKNLQNFVEFKDGYKFLTENETDQAVGTLNYMAPELFTDDYPAGIGIDYWAVGVVIYELFSFKVPFEAKTQKEIQENIINLNINWEPLMNKEIRNKYKNIDAAIDLIKKFLLLNPNDRWGDDNLNDIKNHPFFNGFNWDNIKNMRIPVVLKYLKKVVEDTNKKISKVNEQNKKNPNKDEKSDEDCPFLIDIDLTANEEKYNFVERFDNLYRKNNEIIKKKLRTKEFDIEDNKFRDSFLLDLE